MIFQRGSKGFLRLVVWKQAYEGFEQDCLQQDGVAVVEYAISLQQSGCDIDLTTGPTAGGAPQQGHRRSRRLRRLQAAAAAGSLGQLGQRLGANLPTCRWVRHCSLFLILQN